MKPSKYNIIKQLADDEYVIFNTFNSNISILEDKNDYRESNDFLTDINEYEYLKSLRVEEENSSDYSHYTVFTTTACNARCKYCFEKGCKKVSMSLEKANEIVNFIKENSKNSKRIHIEFFGGEPLLNYNVIDFISKNIISFTDSNNIEYTSNIVTNASLLDEKTIEKLINLKINNVQVTLDGPKKIYEERKNYVSIKNAYDIVLSNIESALKHDMNVSIRINFDKENFNDVLELLDDIKYLNKYKKLYCYCMPIYGDTSNKNIITSKDINYYYQIIFDKLISNNFIKNDKYFRLNKTSIFCHAVKRNTFVFNPNGELFKCTHMLNDSLGDVKNGIIDNDKNNEYSNIVLDNKCRWCKFLPLCQGGCVSKSSQNGCSSKCYIYKDAINAVINSILRLNNIELKIKE